MKEGSYGCVTKNKSNRTTLKALKNQSLKLTISNTRQMVTNNVNQINHLLSWELFSYNLFYKNTPLLTFDDSSPLMVDILWVLSCTILLKKQSQVGGEGFLLISWTKIHPGNSYSDHTHFLKPVSTATCHKWKITKERVFYQVRLSHSAD